MPKYIYKARDASGTPLSDELVARSEAEAVKSLRAEGKFFVKLSKATEQ